MPLKLAIAALWVLLKSSTIASFVSHSSSRGAPSPPWSWRTFTPPLEKLKTSAIDEQWTNRSWVITMKHLLIKVNNMDDNRLVEVLPKHLYPPSNPKWFPNYLFHGVGDFVTEVKVVDMVEWGHSVGTKSFWVRVDAILNVGELEANGCMKLGELPTSSIWDARHPSQSTAIKKYAEDIHSGGQLYSWCLRYTRLFPIMFEHNSSKHALVDKNEWIVIVTMTKGVYRRKGKETQTWWSFYCNALVSIKLLIYLCYILKQTSVYFSPPFDWHL